MRAGSCERWTRRPLRSAASTRSSPTPGRRRTARSPRWSSASFSGPSTSPSPGRSTPRTQPCRTCAARTAPRLRGVGRRPRCRGWPPTRRQARRCWKRLVAARRAARPRRPGRGRAARARPGRHTVPRHASTTDGRLPPRVAGAYQGRGRGRGGGARPGVRRRAHGWWPDGHGVLFDAVARGAAPAGAGARLGGGAASSGPRTRPTRWWARSARPTWTAAFRPPERPAAPRPYSLRDLRRGRDRAGPNGLVAANVLAGAGLDVVREEQPTPGGAVRRARSPCPASSTTCSAGSTCSASPRPRCDRSTSSAGACAGGASARGRAPTAAGPTAVLSTTST